MKLLYESILSSNGAGMKVRTVKWCEENILDRFSKYEILNDGTITGDQVSLEVRCEEIPAWIKWGEIGVFDCSSCEIKSLKNSPQKVARFDCSDCDNLKSLEGASTTVTNEFDCSQCGNLKSLEGAPEEVTKFDCSSCPNLKSLKGGPKKVHDYKCYDCGNLKSLEGAPEEVTNNFTCTHCDNLTSLKGCPKRVNGIFSFENSYKLKKIDALPDWMGGSVYAIRCGKKFTKEDFAAIYKGNNLDDLMLLL